MPSVSWINTKEEVMREEEMFMRVVVLQVAERSPWSAYNIAHTHLLPSPRPLQVSWHPATCITYLNAGSNPRQLSSEEKKAEEISCSSLLDPRLASYHLLQIPILASSFIVLAVCPLHLPPLATFKVLPIRKIFQYHAWNSSSFLF